MHSSSRRLARILLISYRRAIWRDLALLQRTLVRDPPVAAILAPLAFFLSTAAHPDIGLAQRP